MTIQYVMRANSTTISGGYVYWSVLGSPDYTGSESGYNPADLSNIAIEYQIDVPINGDGGVVAPGLAGGDLTGTYPNPSLSSTAPIKKVFNVLAYGALGDGVRDDTASIQSTLNAAAAVQGIVYLPSGVYLISSTLSIPTRVSITGENAGYVGPGNGGQFGTIIRWNINNTSGTMLQSWSTLASQYQHTSRNNLRYRYSR